MTHDIDAAPEPPAKALASGHTADSETSGYIPAEAGAIKEHAETSGATHHDPLERSRTSLRLFRRHATVPEGEGPDFWTYQRLRFLRELLAELIGTFMIVFFGTGSVMSAVYANALVGLFQIAAVWIIGVTMAIAVTASISGAHLNPAVSLAFVLLRPSRAFGWSKLIPYWIAQLLGAMLASCVNYLMYYSLLVQFETENDILRSGPPLEAVQSAKCFGQYYLPPVTTSQAFLVEAFGTFVLTGVIFALTHPANDTVIHNVYIPPLIGMTVGGLISILAPLTQAGFNPARDFGPRIVSYFLGWTQVAFWEAWLYIVAPLVGAPIGGFVIDFLLYAGEPKATATSTTHEN